jgi:hypothetical protein
MRRRRPPQHYYPKNLSHIHPADMMILRPNMSKKTTITVAHGDGIVEADAQHEIKTIHAGDWVYVSGKTAGMEPSAWGANRYAAGWRLQEPQPESHGCRGDIVKTESLRNFDGKQGFTITQGR